MSISTSHVPGERKWDVFHVHKDQTTLARVAVPQNFPFQGHDQQCGALDLLYIVEDSKIWGGMKKYPGCNGKLVTYRIHTM
jgi:hypothetical protein